MRLRLAMVAALVLVALASFPAAAGARARGDAPASRQLLRIELKGSNGFSILIVSDPRQYLALQTTKEEFITEYWTRDTLPAPGQVKAKLFGRGSISVRFHPRGPVRHPSRPGCEGKRPTVQPGVVRGTIEFAGEHGYTQIETNRARAELEKPTSWSCRYEAESEQSRRSREDWTSKLSADADGTYFLARRYRPGVIEGGQALYRVDRGEAFEAPSGRVPLVVWRRAEVTAPASTFDDAHPEHTTISPPPPFTGTGTFFRTPESVFVWRGDLSIQFPGVDPLSLTGPEFEPWYCLREAGCIRQRVEHHPFLLAS